MDFNLVKLNCNNLCNCLESTFGSLRGIIWRHLLLKREGTWTKEEYHEQVMKLEGQTREHSVSPEWDIENGSYPSC